MAADDLDAFMATMVAASVAVPCEEAERFARERYGLRAVATRLTGERDENFKLTCPDGREYVLKLANAAEAPAVTDLPTAALLHVERVDPGLPCPRVLRDRDGLTSSRFEDVAAGVGRTARVLTYLQGKTLRSSVPSSAQRAACGRVAARLGLALRGFTHSAASRPLIWDLRHVGRTVRLLDELVEFPHGSAVAALIATIDARIQAEFGHLRRQVIHNDMNDMNVLVDPEDEDVVVGVIDFGDLVHTALIADVAILAADQIATERGASRDSITDVVKAYHNAVPLLPPELAVLNPLIAGRILSDVLIASWHRRRNPSGTHYADLDPEFIRGRVELAVDVLSSEAPSAELLSSRADPPSGDASNAPPHLSSGDASNAPPRPPNRDASNAPPLPPNRDASNAPPLPPNRDASNAPPLPPSAPL